MAVITSETFPTQQIESTPVPEPVSPPRLSMGEAVGHGLTQIGEELYHVGWQSYQRAAEAQAQEKETEFQNKALKLRDQYRNLYLFDAVKAHDGYSSDLEKARQEISGSVTSKHGLALYMNNSLRGLRYVQESIDSHFETQNRAYQEKTYTDLQLSDTNLLVARGQDDVYNSKSVEEILQRMHDRAYTYARQRGFDDASATSHADREVQKGTGALFGILSHKGNLNRDLTVDEVKKYEEKGWVDKVGAKDALNTLSSANVKSWARQQFVGLTRVDATSEHNPDPEGYVPHEAVKKLQDSILNSDPKKGEKVDALEHEWEVHNHNYEQVGHELRRSVMTQGMLAGGGKFVVPKDSLDWQKFQRLYGDLASIIQDKASNKDWQAWHRGQITAREANQEAYGVVRHYLDTLAPEDAKLVSNEQVETMLMKAYHGPGVEPSDEFKGRALEFLKKLNSGKLDAVERQFNEIARQALSEAYKGSPQLVQPAMNRAHYFLEDQYKESVEKKKPKTAGELREDLVNEFKKGKNGIFGTSFLGSRPGESYQRRGSPSEFEPGSTDWKKLKSGSKFRFKDDPPGRMRTAP